jgi:hypothetical protein
MHGVRSSNPYRQSNPQRPHKTFQRQASVLSEDQEKRNRNKPWYRRASSTDKQQKKSESLDSNENDEDQSAIWHHVFREVDSQCVEKDERSETRYRKCLNIDSDYYYDDEDYSKDGLEMAAGKARPFGGTAIIPSSATSTSVIMETASIGGGRMTTRSRLHKYQQQFSFCAGDRRMSVSV